MAYVDMKMTKKEVKEQYEPKVIGGSKADSPRYPENLKICLYKEQLDKLGIDVTKLNLDDKGEIRARFCVVGTKSEKGEMWGSPEELKIQIKKVQMTFSEEENPEDDLDWDTDEYKAGKVLQKRGVIR